MRSGNNGVALVVVSLTKSTEDVGLDCAKNIFVIDISIFDKLL